jgi:uncharacterized coiled-coil protein SlyX
VTLKLELESRISCQEDGISNPSDAFEALRRSLKDANARIRGLQDNIVAVTRERDELDASLRKQLQLLALKRRSATRLGDGGHVLAFPGRRVV